MAVNNVDAAARALIAQIGVASVADLRAAAKELGDIGKSDFALEASTRRLAREIARVLRTEARR